MSSSAQSTSMPADVTIPNGSITSTTVPSTPITATSAPVAPSAPPPEIEATLSRLSAYRNVRGVMILARTGGSGSGIVQSTGSVFEGESGRKYAGSLEAVVAATAGAVSAVNEGDELKLMRIRTKRHELIITPDEKYTLVVLQDPGQ